jgi:apolipoprotein N-acyltransferase
MIWNSKSDDERFARLLALSERALTNNTDVLLWPEATVPALTDATYAAITNLAVQHKTWIIFGADDVQLRPDAVDNSDYIAFNAAWLVSPRGYIAENYHKQRLVIFGEYVPLARWLPFIRWLTPISGGFDAGTNASQFPLRDAGVNLAPLICFEDCFPHGARSHVTPDTDLLVNLTNDGWFGEGSEQRQHAANAVFRAIENGRPLVRACNNGLTCWIDAHGVIREIFTDERGTIHGAGSATFTVPLGNAPHPPTFYTRHGDIFGWACVALSIIAVANSGRCRKLHAA